MYSTNKVCNHTRDFGLILTLIGFVSAATLVLCLARSASAQTHTFRANGKIAFVSRGVASGTNFDILTIDADGNNRQQLTFDPADDLGPAWSRDGTKIVFERRNSPSRGIYVMNADGSDQRRLTEPAANSGHYSPSWSPDGTKIAFSNFNDFDSSVIVMNADGGDQRTIFAGAFLYPSWSPDGLKLVGNIGYGGLVLINIDGSNFTHITRPPEPFDPATYFADFEPSWSPDGSKIVFTRYVDCDIFDCYTARLYVINPDGSNLTDLTVQDGIGNSPAWSPDGRKIVFGGKDLYVMNPDGSSLTNLTNTTDSFEASPSWQPLSFTPGANPLDDAQFFIRQQYRDFLEREPEPDGLQFYLDILNGCNSADIECSQYTRGVVSANFFRSPEFQRKGNYVMYLYMVSIGQRPVTAAELPTKNDPTFNDRPTYPEFMADLASISTPNDDPALNRTIEKQAWPTTG